MQLVEGLPAAHHLMMVDPTPVKEEELQLRLKDRSSPEWARRFTNARGLVRYDSAQYMVLVGVQGVLLEALVDTGGACSIMDLEFAKRLRLQVVLETTGEYGTFIVPGRTTPLPYPGVV